MVDDLFFAHIGEFFLNPLPNGGGREIGFLFQLLANFIYFFTISNFLLHDLEFLNNEQILIQFDSVGFVVGLIGGILILLQIFINEEHRLFVDDDP